MDYVRRELQLFSWMLFIRIYLQQLYGQSMFKGHLYRSISYSIFTKTSVNVSTRSIHVMLT